MTSMNIFTQDHNYKGIKIFHPLWQIKKIKKKHFTQDVYLALDG